MQSRPEAIRLFHLIHGSNLKGVLGSEGLFSKSKLSQVGLQVTSIAYLGIQERRAVRDVT